RLRQVGEAVHLVRRAVGERRIRFERPALLAQAGNRIGDADCALELFQRQENQRAVRPRAVPGDVEMVATRFRLIAGQAVGADAIAKHALDALELAGPARFLRQLLVLAPCTFDQHSHASFSTFGQGSVSSFSKGARSSGPMRSRRSFFTEARERMRSYQASMRGRRSHMRCRRKSSRRRMYGITAASASENVTPASHGPRASELSIISRSLRW